MSHVHVRCYPAVDKLSLFVQLGPGVVEAPEQLLELNHMELSVLNCFVQPAVRMGLVVPCTRDHRRTAVVTEVTGPQLS